MLSYEIYIDKTLEPIKQKQPTEKAKEKEEIDLTHEDLYDVEECF